MRWKHSGNTYRRELKIRKAVQKQPERENDRGALDYFEIQVALDAAFLNDVRRRV